MRKRLGRDLALLLHAVHVDAEAEVLAQRVRVGREAREADVELVVDGEDLAARDEVASGARREAWEEQAKVAGQNGEERNASASIFFLPPSSLTLRCSHLFKPLCEGHALLPEPEVGRDGHAVLADHCDDRAAVELHWGALYEWDRTGRADEAGERVR